MGKKELPAEPDVEAVEPVAQQHLLAVLARLQPIDEPFPDIDSDLGPLDEPKLQSKDR